MRSLPKSWKVKKTIIFDIEDFSSYKYDELIGPLIAHEIIFKKEIAKKEKVKKNITLKSKDVNTGKKKPSELKVN